MTTVGVQADEAVADATGQPDADVGAAMTASIFDVAGLDSERTTQSAGDNNASQELGTLTGITPPPAATRPGVINIVIIIP